MGIEIEVGLKTTELVNHQVAIAAKFADSLCDGAQAALDAELAKITNTVAVFDSLTSSALDTVGTAMESINYDYLNKCGASTLVDVADAAKNKLTGIQSLSDGAFVAATDTTLSTLSDEVVNLADPVETNESNVYPLDIISFNSYLSGSNIILIIETEYIEFTEDPEPEAVPFPDGDVSCEVTGSGFTHELSLDSFGATTGTFKLELPAPDDLPVVAADITITVSNLSDWVATVTVPLYEFDVVRLNTPGKVVSFFNPLSTNCATHMTNTMGLIVGVASNIDGVINNKISQIGDMVDQWTSFDDLTTLMTQTLASVGGLLACGDTLYDGMAELAPEVIALNSSMQTGLAAVEYAKAVATSPSDLMQIAKEKAIADSGIDTQVVTASINISTKLDALNTI